MVYIRRDYAVVAALFTIIGCLIGVIGYIQYNQAQRCYVDLERSNAELKNCNFEMSIATERYITVLEQVGKCESNYQYLYNQLAKIKNKYPNENIILN